MASTNETGHAKNVANLDELIGFCTSYGVAYNPSKASIKLADKPNEVELQIITLNTQLADLKAKNKAVITATANASNARIARDKTLYAENTGLYDVAQAAKVYEVPVWCNKSAIQTDRQDQVYNSKVDS